MPNTVKTDARCAMLGPLSRTQFCTSICTSGITRQRTTDNPNPISAHDAAFDNSFCLAPITTHPKTQTIRIGNCVANRESKAVSCGLLVIGFIQSACNGRRILCKLIQRPPLVLGNFVFWLGTQVEDPKTDIRESRISTHTPRRQRPKPRTTGHARCIRLGVPAQRTTAVVCEWGRKSADHSRSSIINPRPSDGFRRLDVGPGSQNASRRSAQTCDSNAALISIFRNGFEALIDYLAREAVDCDM